MVIPRTPAPRISFITMVLLYSREETDDWGLQAPGPLLLGAGGRAPWRRRPVPGAAGSKPPQTTILYMPAIQTFSKKLFVYILSSHFVLVAYDLETFKATSPKRIIAKNSKFEVLIWLISHESRNLPGDRRMD